MSDLIPPCCKMCNLPQETLHECAMFAICHFVIVYCSVFNSMMIVCLLCLLCLYLFGFLCCSIAWLLPTEAHAKRNCYCPCTHWSHVFVIGAPFPSLLCDCTQNRCLVHRLVQCWLMLINNCLCVFCNGTIIVLPLHRDKHPWDVFDWRFQSGMLCQ